MPIQADRPPIAGRPPFATEYPDNFYGDQKGPQQGLRPQAAQRRQVDSEYDQYSSDNRNSGVGGIGMGLMNGDMDDDDSDDERPQPKRSGELSREQAERNKALFAAATSPPPQGSSPLATTRQAGAGGRPSFDHQSSANGQNRTPPPPSYQGNGRSGPPQDFGPRQPPGLRPAASDLRLDTNRLNPGTHSPAMAHPIPRAPMPAFMQAPPSPSRSPALNPHPLNAPSTPITPVFARPSFQSESKEIKFSSEAILRGNSEETLLARNTAKGEEFWRRFSFVAKEQPKKQKSTWLKRTEGGSNRMSRWIWCISIFLLLLIGGGIGAGVYFTQDQPDSPPVALGGGDNRTGGPETTGSANERAPASTGRPSLVAPPAVETKRALSPEMDLWVRAAEVEHNEFVAKRHLETHRRLRRNRMEIANLD